MADSVRERESTFLLTVRIGSFVNNLLKSVEDEFVVHKEPEVALHRRFPLGDRLGVRLLLAFLGLVLSVELHGNEPHLLHEPFGLPRVALLLGYIGGSCSDDKLMRKGYPRPPDNNADGGWEAEPEVGGGQGAPLGDGRRTVRGERVHLAE